jgi:hypothetical protein
MYNEQQEAAGSPTTSRPTPDDELVGAPRVQSSSRRIDKFCAERCCFCESESRKTGSSSIFIRGAYAQTFPHTRLGAPNNSSLFSGDGPDCTASVTLEVFARLVGHCARGCQTAPAHEKANLARGVPMGKAEGPPQVPTSSCHRKQRRSKSLLSVVAIAVPGRLE